MTTDLAAATNTFACAVVLAFLALVWNLNVKTSRVGKKASWYMFVASLVVALGLFGAVVVFAVEVVA